MDLYILAESSSSLTRAGLVKIAVRRTQIVVSPTLNARSADGVRSASYHITRHVDCLHFRRYIGGKPDQSWPCRSISRCRLDELDSYEVISVKQFSPTLLTSAYFKKYERKKREIVYRSSTKDSLHYLLLSAKTNTDCLRMTLSTQGAAQIDVVEYDMFDLISAFYQLDYATDLGICDMTHVYVKTHPAGGIDDFLPPAL